MTSVRTASPEPSTIDSTHQKSNNIQLTIHTTYLDEVLRNYRMVFLSI